MGKTNKESKSIVEKFWEFFSGFFLILILFSVNVGVIDRFLLKIGIAWTTELASFSLVWFGFSSALIALFNNEHFYVSLIIEKISFARRYFRLLNLFICFLVCSVLFIAGLKAVNQGINRVSACLRIPMSYIYLIIPAISIFMSGVLFLNIFNYKNTKMIQRK